MPITFRPHIYDEVLKNPYSQGYRQAKVITGFASSSFIYHVVHEFPDLDLDVIIGMARQNGVSLWDHKEYIRIADSTGRLNVRYYQGKIPVHIKGVLWPSNKTEIAFTGSSNFSWNGFRDFDELMVDVSPIELRDAFPNENLINCKDPGVEATGLVLDSIGARLPKSLRDIAISKEVVHLPLFSEKQKRMHERSGLNWGQRPEYSREPNQAYLPVPKSIHDEHSDFFPPKNEEFTLVTDDGESFICVMAQDNRKAIETRYDNSILGKYFRARLKVPQGDFVTMENLVTYGRKTVSIYKLSRELYYLDFLV